jgi:hypothetical protein
MFLGDVEVWLDLKTWMPLKMVMNEEDFESVMLYESIEYNQKFDDDLFIFTPPEGAKVESFEESMESHMPENMSIEEIQEQVDFNVPQITEIPKGYELIGSYFDKEFNLIDFGYENNSGEMINLTISPVGEDVGYPEEMMEEAQRITVNGNAGLLVGSEGMFFLSWEKEDLSFMLAGMGPSMTSDSLLKVAESVE